MSSNPALTTALLFATGVLPGTPSPGFGQSCKHKWEDLYIHGQECAKCHAWRAKPKREIGGIDDVK